MARAYIVLGLVFGDEGKGATVDALSSTLDKSGIVVRFSGGQQVGHGVQTETIKHVFSNFGAGTLRKLPTYFSEHCTMYPVSMFNELNVLRSKGIEPEIYFHPLTKVTTPYDVMYNRLQGNGNTCGLGIGATMDRNINSPYKLFAVDLLHPNILKEKLEAIKSYYHEKVGFDNILKFILACDKEVKYFEEAVLNLSFNIKNYDYLDSFKNVIFEGSQGILLDMDHGIFPNVTYANTTSKNALEICDLLGIRNIHILYVTRCYQTRHGDGWMSNNTPVELINTESEINEFNIYQGQFRIAEFDYNLINQALKIDDAYSYYIKHKHLCLTCLDQRPDFKFDESLIGFPLSSIIRSKWIN